MLVVLAVILIPAYSKETTKPIKQHYPHAANSSDAYLPQYIGAKVSFRLIPGVVSSNEDISPGCFVWDPRLQQGWEMAHGDWPISSL